MSEPHELKGNLSWNDSFYFMSMVGMDGLSIKISHKAEATTRGPGGVLQKSCS